jgi:hypothetical protein
MNAAADDVPLRPDVYVANASRDESVAPEQQKHIVVQKYG